MEDPTQTSDRALHFAILTLVVRLVATQSSVFSSWYSRRCYERSRGEMLTMLHEKTLSRKKYSTLAQPEAIQLSETPESNAVLPENSRTIPIRERLTNIVGSVFHGGLDKPAIVKERASDGKIYNLMR